MYRIENEFSQIGYNTFVPPPALSDLTHYINPHVKNTRVENAIGNHVQGFRKQPKPDTYKTVMCQAWLESMSCTFGENCKFAHGEKELRPSTVRIRNHQKYKTKLCEKYTLGGICPYGIRCLFIHPDLPQPKPESTFASMIGSENSSLVSVATPFVRPSSSFADAAIFRPSSVSPTTISMQSIWTSNPKHVGDQQQKFSKSGGGRFPVREMFIESPAQGKSDSMTDSSLPFNQTAEAMVSFLWA